MVNRHFRFNFPLTDTIVKFKDENGKWCIQYSCDVCLTEGEHHTRVFNRETEADEFYKEALACSHTSVAEYYGFENASGDILIG